MLARQDPVIDALPPQVKAKDFDRDINPSSTSLIETDNLLDYIRNIATALLGFSRDTCHLTCPHQPLEQLMDRFISDSQFQAVYLTRLDISGGIEFHVHDISVTYQSPCVVFIKKNPYLDQSGSLFTQILVVSLPATPSENEKAHTLHGYVQFAFSPYMNSSPQGETTPEKTNEHSALLGAKKKMAELQLCLAGVQQDISIPEIQLTLHTEILDYLETNKESIPRIDHFSSRLDDSVFLNSLQNNVNSWIREVQRVTNLTKDAPIRSARSEITFWATMEKKLGDISRDLDAPGISLTLDILRAAKRFHATVSFLSDTGLKDALDTAQKSNQLLKDLPIDEILTAPDLIKLSEALGSVFSHINRKLRLSAYPVKRGLLLVEAISKDFIDQVSSLMRTKNLMTMAYSEFSAVMSQVENVFLTWDSLYKEFANIARDLTRKRGGKFLPIRINDHQSKLRERLNQVRQFRHHHEELVKVINYVNSDQSTNMIRDNSANKLVELSPTDLGQDLQIAYEAMKHVDVFDLSEGGDLSWRDGETLYMDRISQVENRIVANLRDQLANASSTAEMFRVFGRYNALFVRPKIRGAVHEYQTQLLNRVKADISSLHERFVQGYDKTEAKKAIALRDLPSLAGAIIWAKQIERRLDSYMERVEAVLGKGWDQYAEGQKLEKEERAFKRQLNVKHLFDQWVSGISNMDPGMQNLVFSVARRKSKTTSLTLKVDFDATASEIFKDVRSFIWLGYPVPHSIVSLSRDMRKIFPSAVALRESLSVYNRCMYLLEEHPTLQPLFVTSHASIRKLIEKFSLMRWSYFSMSDASAMEMRQSQLVLEFSSLTSEFHRNLLQAVSTWVDFERHLAELGEVKYDHNSFSDKIKLLQKCVDSLESLGIANIEQWVSDMNNRIGAILKIRLNQILKAWVSFWQGKEEQRAIEWAPFMIDILLENKTVCTRPSLEHAQEYWLYKLDDLISVCTQLPKIQVFKFLPSELSTAHDSQFDNLILELEDEILPKAYDAFHNSVRHVNLELSKWTAHETLWRLQESEIFHILGSDLEAWLCVLTDLRRLHSETEHAVTQDQKFGGICLRFETMRERLGLQYESWYAILTNQFSLLFAKEAKTFSKEVRSAVDTLESMSMSGPVRDLINSLQLVMKSKATFTSLELRLSQLAQGQKLLDKDHFSYPDDWIFYDQLHGDWSAFIEIYTKQTQIVEDRFDYIKSRFFEENQVMAKRIKLAIADWDETKPISGKTDATEASNILNEFERKFNQLLQEWSDISVGFDLFDVSNIERKDQLTRPMEELLELRSVWCTLSTIQTELHIIEDVFWFSDNLGAARTKLIKLIDEIKQTSDKHHHFVAFEQTLELLQKKQNKFTRAWILTSNVLRERHLARIMKLLGLPVEYNASGITVGMILSSESLDIHYKEIEAIVHTAQGEFTIENYLREVNAYWDGSMFEYVSYKSKCRLIRGWDVVINKCQDHISAFSSMKRSSYFKIHEQEALTLEQKLQKLGEILDKWVQVQKQWIYLEGIFSDSADVRHLLPLESSKFIGADAEYMGLLRHVYKCTSIFEVLSVPNILRSIQRLDVIFDNIARALGEYLEKERRRFARFYFLGDDNLLELLGNSRNLKVIQTHLPKMFPGITSLVLNSETPAKITHVSGKGGDILPLTTEMVFMEGEMSLCEWLQCLEKAISSSLLAHLKHGISKNILQSISSSATPEQILTNIVDAYPAQVIELLFQIFFTYRAENSIVDRSLHSLENQITEALTLFGKINMIPTLTRIQRRKCEQIITELVHQRDLVNRLVTQSVTIPSDFIWTSQCRYYWDEKSASIADAVRIQIADASFFFGFEYLGAEDKLVHTQLTGRCYLSLTQALHYRMGGSPTGPAGTGKTETVKSLGSKLGRLVLVFCCDETFDFQSIGRILSGLCQLGAWGCFDEFNRLEPRILSAVAQQIVEIQSGLRSRNEISLLGNSLQIRQETGVFITMNPDYAGRARLPENLKRLFRSVIMNAPEVKAIAQVMLYARGFSNADVLADLAVDVFRLCKDEMTLQQHYDFGLRALKSVLVYAGKLTRRIQSETNSPQTLPEEKMILMRAIVETVVPKLVMDDVQVMERIAKDTFSLSLKDISLVDDIFTHHLSPSLSQMYLHPTRMFVEKVEQVYKMLKVHHGIMLVGPSGCGKTSARKLITNILERAKQLTIVTHLLDPKIIGKKALYGRLDVATREWTDGIFTTILRKSLEDKRSNVQHWIVFDGDIDPEWVENLNSVLDDNRRLTLPTGESLEFPDTMKIIFEVSNVRKATPATVTRCGMVWFPEETITVQDLTIAFVQQLRQIPIDILANRIGRNQLDHEHETFAKDQMKETISPIQKVIAESLQSLMVERQILRLITTQSETLQHVMKLSTHRCTWTLFNLLVSFVMNAVSRQESYDGEPLDVARVESHVSKQFFVYLLHSFGGDLKLQELEEFSTFVQERAVLRLPESLSLLDVSVDANSGNFVSWNRYVPIIELDDNAYSKNIMVPTVDTVRLENILESLLIQRRLIVLCGPPGSGKTMSLISCLRRMPDMDVISLNFSSGTTVQLLTRTIEAQCVYRKTSFGGILSPKDPNRWLVVFCDEINLPSPDTYDTQRTTSFIRFAVENSGYWSPDGQWVKLDRIQFVGACNPPTDLGRYPLCTRFLRLCSVIFVDYPSQQSLTTIYSAFTKSIVQKHPRLRDLALPIANGMAHFYEHVRRKFDAAKMSQLYVYSPRELTRWTYSLAAYLRDVEDASVESCLKFWVYEAFRLFQDRLISEEERSWTADTLNQVTYQVFKTQLGKDLVGEKLFFCNYLSKTMQFVNLDVLQDFLVGRGRIFCEEQGYDQLILFPQFVEHVLRLDRVLKQERGHYLLLGRSGCGKKMIVRFTAWLQGMSIVSTQFHKNYHMEDFEQELRGILKRTGLYGEKVVFLVNETGISQTAFLERMNTLLTQGDITDLYENEEHQSLFVSCKDMMRKEGISTDSEEAVYEWFTCRVRANLHVVFTLNVDGNGLMEKAIASPALVNRCNLDWFGDWTPTSFALVARRVLSQLDASQFSIRTDPKWTPMTPIIGDDPNSVDIIADVMTQVHLYFEQAKASFKNGHHYQSARHFLDFVKDFVRLFEQRKSEVETRYRHLVKGLDRLKDTFSHVEKLRSMMSIKQAELAEKEKIANEKLKSILEQQSQAERNQADSVRLQQDLDEQNEQIQSRQQVVLQELEAAEPAVFEAQESVSHIKRQHLTEVRAMGNPPDAVKLTMEAVCILLGFKIDSWKAVQTVLRRDDFISSIVNYDTPKLPSRLREEIKNKYLSDENFTFEIVNRASKACGPLMLWVKAQVNYSDILEKVGPLREEVVQLEQTAEVTALKATEVKKTLEDLQATIALYKADYAKLIADVQSLKVDMEKVESRISRSIQLMNSLSSEKTRWQQQQDAFQEQMACLIGDSLLISAFINYCGSYDHGQRLEIISAWKDRLRSAGIVFNPFLSFDEHIVQSDELRDWEGKGLPSDSLCRENAAILGRCNRYPLIIDPSGQAIAFLLGDNSTSSILRTSFRQANYLKMVETAMRFGQPIVIENAEDYDPILDQVISRNIVFTGGRHVCRLGSKEVDFSASFKLFLITKDSHYQFRSDICSRMVVVNFTMTETRLVAQCLDRVLKAERPEINEKKIEISKLQGVYQLQLFKLEQELLEALNQGSGDILENEQLMKTLETLKSEATRIGDKMSEMDVVVQEIEGANSIYYPFAETCSSIYFLMEDLSLLNPFYLFSLDLFYEIFDEVIATAKNGSLGATSRLQSMWEHIFQRTLIKLAPSLSYTEQLILGVTLGILKLKTHNASDDGRDQLTTALLQSLIGRVKLAVSDVDAIKNDNLRDLPGFEALEDWIQDSKEEFKKVLRLILLENSRHMTEIIREQIDFAPLLRLLVVRYFRPDLLPEAVRSFINSTIGGNVLQALDQMDKLRQIVEENVSIRPVLICQDAKQDNGYRVEQLAQLTGKRCICVSLGSQESLAFAEQQLSKASHKGDWVLIKNAHLEMEWIGNLEAIFSSLSVRPIVFLTMDATVSPPANLLRMARTVWYEPSTGLKSALSACLTSIPPNIQQNPAEKTRLFLGLSWLHATVLERLRYVPTGWSMQYEFGETEFTSALQVIDSWMTSASDGRTNISPDKIPWEMMQKLLIITVYGGKIENKQDEEVLAELCKKYIAADIVTDHAKLSSIDPPLMAPNGYELHQIMEWVSKLPTDYPASWIELSQEATSFLTEKKGQEIMERLQKIYTDVANIPSRSDVIT